MSRHGFACFRSASPPARRAGRRGGFTLMELILILVIIGSLAAIVAPSLGGLRARSRIDGVARTLASLLNEAAARAAIEARPMRVWIDTQDSAAWLEGWTDTGFVRPEATYGMKAPLDVTFDLDPRDADLEATGFAVRFEPDGRGAMIQIAIHGKHGAQRVVYRPSVTEPYRVFDPNRPDELGEGSDLAY